MIRNDIDGTDPKDIKYTFYQLITSYVTSGYAPISARLVQAAVFNTSPLADVAKLLGCEYTHEEQRAVVETENNKTMVVFIGGVSLVEVSAIRLLKKLDPSAECVILTTNILEENEILKDFMYPYKEEIVEKEQPEKLQEVIEELEEVKEKVGESAYYVCCHQLITFCLYLFTSKGKCLALRRKAVSCLKKKK